MNDIAPLLFLFIAWMILNDRSGPPPGVRGRDYWPNIPDRIRNAKPPSAPPPPPPKLWIVRPNVRYIIRKQSLRPGPHR